MSETCPRLGRLIKACKFEPRYDLGAVIIDEGFSYKGSGDASAILNELREKTYVKDVCVTCGKTIVRQSA